MHVPPAPLVVTELARRFGPRWALAGVSFSLDAGDALMLTGPNGSGKSTLLRCLGTALKPQRGQITFGGRDLWEHRHLARQALGWLGHQAHLWDDLDGRDNLRAWARLAGLTADVDAALRRVGLDPRRTEPVRAFSAGMRRRLSLARLVIKRPSLLLLDEPFTALDPDGRALLVDVIRELRAHGASLVLATHLPSSAVALAERGIHLVEGRVVWAGPSRETPARDGEE